MKNINHYNFDLSKLYFNNFPNSLYSPFLSRAEGQSLYFLRGNYFTLFSKVLFYLPIKLFRDILFVGFSKKVNFNFSNKIVVISYFDNRSLKSGIVNDEYFRDILVNQDNVITVYKIINHGHFKNPFNSLLTINKNSSNFNILNEYSLLSFFDLIKSFFYSIYIFFKLVLGVQLYDLKSDYFSKAIIVKRFLFEFFNGDYYYNILQNRLSLKLLQLNPSLVIYPWESLPWERIFEKNKNLFYSHVYSKGFQHTGFSKNLLQHFPSSIDINLPIFPNEIICNGNINKDQLIVNNIPSKISVSRALRQNHLLGKLNLDIHEFPKIVIDGLKVILVTLSYSKFDYLKIFKLFESIDSRIKVYFKVHPLHLSNFPKVEKENFYYITEIDTNVMSSVDVIFSHDNSWIFESLLYSKHSISINLYDDLDSRDFNSSFIHANESNIQSIIDNPDLIYKSTVDIINSNYLNLYFSNKDLTLAKFDFFNFNHD
uniref:hypothetical protein n=1 Tax=Flavobacterium sp. TaxID=239 RepID=UPI0040497188